MTKRKANRKPKPRNGKARSSARHSTTASANPPLPDDRHKLVALVFASLVAGLMFVVNADRVTHVSSELAMGASRHGWPWVYLERELKEEPLIYIQGETYSWPYPAANKENRVFYANRMIYDLLVLGAITVVTYWVVGSIGYRFNRWQGS
jgi:hypothetical protein